MVKLKFDVSDSDVESAKEGNFGGFADPPTKGLHRFSIKEVNVGHSKDDAGKPDPTKPRVEVVLECLTPKHKGAHIWAYFLQKGHSGYVKRDAEKWDQLLLALGIASESKRTGTIDTDKQMVGKVIVVNVKAGKDRAGDYRAEYGAAFPDGHDGVAAEEEDLLDESGSDDGELADDGDMADDGATDWDARRAELMAAGVPDLKDIAKAYEIPVSGKKKAQLVDEFIEYEMALEAGGGDGDLVEDDELLADEDELVDDSPASSLLTEEQLAAMDTADLIKTAKDFDLVTKGKRKSEVIAEILAAQGSNDDEMPF